MDIIIMVAFQWIVRIYFVFTAKDKAVLCRHSLHTQKHTDGLCICRFAISDENLMNKIVLSSFG